LDSIPEEDKGKGVVHNAWFGCVRDVSEMLRHVFQIKQNYSLYSKASFEEALKEAQDGSILCWRGRHNVRYLSLQLGTNTVEKQFYFFSNQGCW